VKVVVAMSGGVDSSVAAMLLRDQGHEILGVFLRNGIDHPERRGAHHGCCSAVDACDAEEVASILGVPFYSIDSRRSFASIIQSFVDDYSVGLTPNPCVLCNRDLKFGELLEFALAMGAWGVATGHYARCGASRDGRLELRRGLDRRKDQSYVLAMVHRESLLRSLFPLGELLKEQVREIARQAGLPTHNKRESQEICFVPSGDHRDILREHRPRSFRKGDIRRTDGTILGEHDGAIGCTVGQRHGLRLGGTGPYYVLSTAPESNEVVVGRKEELLQRECSLDSLCELAPPLELGGNCQIQLRAHHVPCAAMVVRRSGDSLLLRLEGPGEVLTPGQYGVVYRGDRVMAAGRIHPRRTRKDLQSPSLNSR